MVMEFSDSVMDVDRHDINSSHWKQFTEVSRFSFKVLNSDLFFFGNYYIHKLR